MIYVIGSLRNPKIPEVSAALREHGFEVFDDWYAAGPHADDAWREYEKGRGHDLPRALHGYAARHVFEFDKRHLERASSVVLVCPAGRSGHLEFGWCAGRGKRSVILLDGDPERYDVMLCFADEVVTTLEGVVAVVKGREEHEFTRRLRTQSTAREGYGCRARASSAAQTHNGHALLGGLEVVRSDPRDEG